MSLIGRLIGAGVGVGGNLTQQRAYARAGMIAQGPSNGPFGGAPGPHIDPAVAAVIFDDFFSIHKNSSDEVDWLISAIQGTNTVECKTQYNGSGGELVLTSGTTTGDGDHMQWHHVGFKPLETLGRDIWFAAMVALSHIGVELGVGLANQNTDFSDTGLTNGIYFHRATDGTTTARARDGGDDEDTEISDPLSSAGVYCELGFHVTSAIATFYVNGSRVAEASAEIPWGTPLGPFVGLVTGGDAARAVAVDWIKVIQLR